MVWPKQGGPVRGFATQRPGQKRNRSIRGVRRVREALEAAVFRLDPLNGGDFPLAAVALWISAHAKPEGTATRFLLANWR